MEEETGIILDHNEVKFAYAVNTIFPDISKQYVTVSALGESMAHDCVRACKVFHGCRAVLQCAVTAACRSSCKPPCPR